MIQDFTIAQLLKIIFDVKQEMSSYQKEDDAKTINLENIILIQ